MWLNKISTKCDSTVQKWGILLNLEIEYMENRYRFLSFAKNIDKSFSKKYSQKALASAKKSATNAIKTASKRSIQKTAEATCDLIDNKIADKITSISKKSPKHLQNDEMEAPKKIHISRRKETNYRWIKVGITI